LIRFAWRLWILSAAGVLLAAPSWRQSYQDAIRAISQKQYAAAEQSLNEMLKLSGDDADRKAMAWNSFGYLYKVQGRHGEAAGWYAKAVAALEAKHGPRHLSLGSVLTNQAIALQAAGDAAAAERAAARAAGITEKGYGPNDPRLALSLYHLGRAALAQGKHAEAKAALERALRIREAGSQDSREITATLSVLAKVYRGMKRLEDEEGVWKRYFTVRDALNRQPDSEYRNAVAAYASLLREKGDGKGAAAVEGRLQKQ
jgi:tetratricopeptide (TPR) repeat protein